MPFHSPRGSHPLGVGGCPTHENISPPIAGRSWWPPHGPLHTARPASRPVKRAPGGVCVKKNLGSHYIHPLPPRTPAGARHRSLRHAAGGLPPIHPHASRKIFSCAGHPPTQNAASRTLLSRGKFAGRVGHKVSPQSATHQLGTRLPACRACTMTGPISRWRLTRHPASHACSMTGPIRYRV